MNKLLEALNKLLSFLPFDGSKTIIGLALPVLLKAALQFYPELELLEPVLVAASAVLVALGVLHKAVKEAIEKGFPFSKFLSLFSSLLPKKKE